MMNIMKIMTREDKDLLLKDLCARLPYGVILNYYNVASKTLTLLDYKWLVDNDYDVYKVKPYLLPISSMTEEQDKEFMNIQIGYPSVDWFNKNHFDYRGLIEKGLAIDATGLNIY
jgi:hypothetical protein